MSILLAKYESTVNEDKRVRYEKVMKNAIIEN
jgi:hypothetical protein